MEKGFSLHDVVWARARTAKSDIFWPAQVLEITSTKRSKKKVASVRFLGENTYEDIKNPNDIKKWDCDDQYTYIQQGRSKSGSLKDPNMKILFNKGIKEAKDLTDNPAKERSTKSPAKKAQHNSSATVEAEICGVSKVKKKKNTSKEIMFIDDNNIASNVNEEGYSAQNNVESQVSQSNKVYNEKQTTGPRKTSPQKGCIDGEGNSSKVHVSQSATCLDSKEADVHSRKSKTTKLIGTKSKLPRSNSMDSNRNRERTSKRIASSVRSPIRKRRRKSADNINVTESVADVIKDVKPSRKRKVEDIDGLKSKCKENGLSSPCEKLRQDTEAANHSNVKTNKKLKNFTKELGQKESASSVCGNANQITNNNSKVTSVNNVNNTCNNSADGWDSDESSDRELMATALSPSPTDMKFELNDVVWAKMNRDPYWPGQVTRILKKPKKIYVKFLGSVAKRSFSCKRILPFACDTEKREELMKEASSHDASYFQNAFTEAEDLVRKKALGIPIEPEEDEDYEQVDNDEVMVDNEENKEEKVAPSIQIPDEPTDARRSTRTKKQTSKYNHGMLSYIRESKPILKEILEEKRPSERHQVFTSGSVKEKNALKCKSGFGPISDSDLEDDIMEMLRDFYNEVTNYKQDMSQVTYIADVWLPEAMIYALQKIDNVDRMRAEDIYQKGTSHVSNNSHRELVEQLKGKTLTDEDRNASIERAKRL